MLQAHAFPAVRQVHPAADALLDELDPLPGARALVIGRNTLETLCALIRRGCAGAAELRPGRSGAAPDRADVAVLPDPASPEEAAAAVGIAWRALGSGGRIAVRAATGRHAWDFAALLRAQGFAAVCVRIARDSAMVVGERPAAVAGRA